MLEKKAASRQLRSESEWMSTPSRNVPSLCLHIQNWPILVMPNRGVWFVFDLGFKGIFMPVLRFAARRALSAYVAKRLEQTASEARQCFPCGCVMIVMH